MPQRRKQKHYINSVGRVTPFQLRQLKKNNNMPQGRDRSEFALGIEGERWEPSLPALLIPIPGTEFHFMCIRAHDSSFVLYAMQSEQHFDDLLMLVAVTLERIKEFKVKNGKEIQEDMVEMGGTYAGAREGS